MPRIKQAIAMAGGQKKLAEALGVTQQSVSEWARRGYFPLDRARQVKEITGVPVIDLVSPAIAEALGVK